MKSHVTAEPRFASLRSQRFPNWAASQPRLEVFHFISVMETVKFRYHWQNVMFANVLQPSTMHFPLNSERWQFINYHIFRKIFKDGTGLPTESNLSLTLANFPRKELGLGENWNLFHTCMLPFSLDPREMWLPSTHGSLIMTQQPPGGEGCTQSSWRVKLSFMLDLITYNPPRNKHLQASRTDFVCQFLGTAFAICIFKNTLHFPRKHPVRTVIVWPPTSDGDSRCSWIQLLSSLMTCIWCCILVIFA